MAAILQTTQRRESGDSPARPVSLTSHPFRAPVNPRWGKQVGPPARSPPATAGASRRARFQQSATSARRSLRLRRLAARSAPRPRRGSLRVAHALLVETDMAA
jgi:hypothetical protein